MAASPAPKYSERVQGIINAHLTGGMAPEPGRIAVEPVLTPSSTATSTTLVQAYTHEAMLEAILANPSATHKQLAGLFGKTAGWFATVLASDSFQAVLEPRRGEVCDPSITATLDERLRALAMRSLMVLQEKLDSPAVSDMVVLEAAKIGVKGLGLGNATVALPAPAHATGAEAVADRIMQAMAAAQQRSNATAIDVEVKRGS